MVCGRGFWAIALWWNFLQAQPFHGVALSGAKGTIVEHTRKMSHLIENRTFFMQLDFYRSTDGSKLWHHRNLFPDYGLLLNYQDLGNPKYLGSAYAVASFIELPLHSPRSILNWKVRLAGGLAYVTKRFDAQSNHKHVALSSHLNVFAAVRWALFVRLHRNLFLIPNLQFSHVSNGRFSVPNLGINTLYPNVALLYAFKKGERKVPTDSSAVLGARNEFYVWFGYGRNQEYPPGQRSFSNYTVSVHYVWNLRQRHQIGIGADAFYEPSLNIRTQNQENVTRIYFKNGFSTGIKWVYAFQFGNWNLPLEYGYYVFSGVHQFPNGLHFHRVGVRYYHKSSWVFSFTLKSHFAVAYHFDVGIGKRFFRSRL